MSATSSTLGLAAALVSTLVMGNTALAQVPGPQANQVWGGCVLSTGALQGLEQDINAPAIGDVEIAFVVVYALNNDNDGQPLTAGGFTGPIICRNYDLVGIATTTQDADIPDPTTGAQTVDTLDVEDVFILRYVLNEGSDSGKHEKVICHTVDSNVDCFRISPLID